MNDPCKKCEICKSEDLSLRYTVTDTNQHIPGSWDILVCNNCGTGVLCPFPDAKQVASYYDKIFYTKEGSRFRGWIEGLRTFLGALRGRTLNALQPQKDRVDLFVFFAPIDVRI